MGADNEMKKSKKSKKKVSEDPVAAVTDESEKQAKKKKKKKEKKAREAAAAMETTEPAKEKKEEGATEESKTSEESIVGNRRLKKSLKKKKKKAEAEAAAAATAAAGAPAAVEADAATTEEKKKKKKKKKKTEKKEEEAPAAKKRKVPEEAKEAEPAVPEKKQKKAAGICRDGTSGGATSTTMTKAGYVEDPSVTAQTDAEVAEYRKSMDMTVTGGVGGEIKPIKRFTDVVLPSFVQEFCSQFEKPSPIQAQAWPALMQGRDVIGIAKTGSGKTLGFMAPGYLAIQKGLKKNPMSRQTPGPRLLVLAPTRELAMQTAVVCDKLEGKSGIHAACIYGGVDKWPQIDALKKGLHICIATPGRLLGLIREGACTLTQVGFLVLDEADRMLDMGFEPDIRAIIGYIGDRERQTLLFSATWPKSIMKLGNEFVNNPFMIKIGSDELTANSDVTQIVEVLHDDGNYNKDKKLLTLINKYHNKERSNRMIVFVLYKKDVARVERLLNGKGFVAGSISSDRTQAERTKALGCFTDGSCPILVATDVAARGLDIPNVSHVINYSFPLTVEDYVHRIGRTGRGGKTGMAHTFFTKFDKTLAGELVNLLRDSGAEIPEDLPKFGVFTKKKQHGMYGAFYRSDDDRPMKKAVKVRL